MLETTENFGQMDRLEHVIGAYREAAGRGLAFAIVKTGRELAFALKKETANITPSRSLLEDLPQRLGYRIKRAPSGKGYYGPAARDGAVFFRKIGKKLKLGGQRGSSSVAREILRRIRSRKFHSIGWDPAVKAFQQQGRVFEVNSNYGQVRAQLDMLTGNGIIKMRNNTGIIETLSEQKGLLKKAIDQVIIGMKPYIERKLGEAAAASFAKF